MRQLKKEQAIQEYGLKYVPALDAIDFDLDLHPEIPQEPRNALAKELEKLSKPVFDGTLRLVEELGSATRDFHFRDIQDVRQRYETETRARYKKTLETLEDLMADRANSVLLKHAMDSEKPEQQRLKIAFEQAKEKMVHISHILNSGSSFKIDITPLKDEITLPDTILKPGATVYIVKNDGMSIPSIVSGTVTQCDISSALFSKPDFRATYEIDTGEAAAGKSVRLEKTFRSVDKLDSKKPAGAVAAGLNKAVFNSKAAAVAYVAEELDAKEAGLKAQLKELRAARKQLKR